MEVPAADNLRKKWRKVPYQPNERAADTTKPGTRRAALAKAGARLSSANRRNAHSQPQATARRASDARTSNYDAAKARHCRAWLAVTFKCC